jgi:hypothetical protein
MSETNLNLRGLCDHLGEILGTIVEGASDDHANQLRMLMREMATVYPATLRARRINDQLLNAIWTAMETGLDNNLAEELTRGTGK